MFFHSTLARGIAGATLIHGGISYSVRIDSEAIHPLQVWHGSLKISESLRRDYRPWALQVADVDGDGIDEIAVGLTKRTHNLPFPHRTLFIMRFNGHDIVRKWAGSSMGRPLLEFCFGPKIAGHGQVLFTLEKRMDGKIALSAHRWNGFGFEKVGSENVWASAQSLRCDGARLVLQAEGHRLSLPWRELL